jgi:hypothetical protein
MEAFSYVAQGPDGGEPWLIGKRMKPFGLDVLGEGKMPYRFLIARVQRFAVREFSRDPDLAFETFKSRLGQHFFGRDATQQQTSDLLELQRIWMHGSDWYWSSPLIDPAFFGHRAKRLKWPTEKLDAYEKDLTGLKQLAARYAKATHPTEMEMARLSATVAQRWGTNSPVRLP